MPIRFRCKYCNQLMGIARRKVGTEVECPTCKGKLLVPEADQEPAPPPVPPKPPVQPPIFERSDFSDFLNPQPKEPVLAGAQQPAAGAVPPRPQPAAQQRALRMPSPYDVDVEPMPGATAAPLDPNAVGILLSPARATLLTVAVILGLALAFSAGLLVGHYLNL
jgi:hypothetical protein